MSELRLGSSRRSMEVFTASALNSAPSWNLMPSRSLMVYSKPSSEISGRSAARQGDTLASVLPYWYRPSWMLQDTTADSPSSKYAGSTARGSAVRLYVMVSDIPLGASPPPWPSAGFSPPPPPQPAMLTRPKLAAETPSSSTNRRLLNACLLASMCSPSLKPRFSGALPWAIPLPARPFRPSAPFRPCLARGGARSRGAAYLHTLVQHSARVVDFYANETFSPRCGPRAAAAAWPGLEGTASGSRLAGPQTRREVPDRGHAHAVGCQHRGHRHGVLPDVPPALFRRGILCGQGHSRR